MVTHIKKSLAERGSFEHLHVWGENKPADFENSSFNQLMPNRTFHFRGLNVFVPSADPEGGGQGVRTPPGKSQVIWVSIGNKQLDPPGKSWTPLENVGPTLEP